MGFDEMLFYGGLLLAGISALAGIVTAFLLKIQRIRLNTRLDEEYGAEKQKH